MNTKKTPEAILINPPWRDTSNSPVRLNGPEGLRNTEQSAKMNTS